MSAEKLVLNQKMQIEKAGGTTSKEEIEDILDRQMLRRIRERIAYVLIGVFATFNALVMLICLLQRPLSDGVLATLIGASAVELAAMMIVIVKFLFPGREAQIPKRKASARRKPRSQTAKPANEVENPSP